MDTLVISGMSCDRGAIGVTAETGDVPSNVWAVVSILVWAIALGAIVAIPIKQVTNCMVSFHNLKCILLTESPHTINRELVLMLIITLA